MKLKKQTLKITALIIGTGFLLLIVLIKLLPLINTNENPGTITNIDVSNEKAPGYGIVADNAEAVDIGMQILRQGGSAVDAAIAVSYALGVVSPFASGIGGGGVMLVYPSDGTAPVVYDYMGTAPENVMDTIAVPGFVKGMAAAQNDYGKLTMDALLEPSIKLANEGIKVTPLLNSMVDNSGYKIDNDVKINFFPDGEAIKSGEVFKQPVLADTMEKIKTNGSEDFYSGEVANEIADSGSGLSLNDLASYQVDKRSPVLGSFSGYDVYSSTPPSGGVTLIQTLALSEKLNLDHYPINSANYISLLAGISQVTSHDRLGNINDPDYYAVDADKLISEEYINQLALQVTESKDLNQLVVEDTPLNSKDGENTTHIVVYDKTGMMVSVTNTLTYWFGNGKNVGGFFMNSHMENFSTSASSLNKAETGKRPRSYISPTILVKDGKPIIGIGSPGGQRIPLMITQVIEGFLKNNMPLQEAVGAPRFFNDKKSIYLEDNYLTMAEEDNLRGKGYSIVSYPKPLFYGGVNTLYIDYEKRKISGGADFRRDASWKWEAN